MYSVTTLDLRQAATHTCRISSYMDTQLAAACLSGHGVRRK